MPFPLPRDPDFLKEVVESWIEDVDERLAMGDLGGANHSLSIARSVYLSLPPGHGNNSLEEGIVNAGVKIEQHYQRNQCAQ